MSRKTIKNKEAAHLGRKKNSADDLSIISPQVPIAENVMSDVPSTSHECDAEHILSEPLDEFASRSDHLRRLCAKMADAAKSADINSGLISQILDALKSEVPRQFTIEADELFPLLRARARRDDDFAAVMSMLLDDHNSILAQIRLITPRLDTVRQAALGSNDDRWLSDALSELAARLYRHLSLLNAVILPIARLRFSEDDLKALAQGMLASKRPE